MNDFIYKKGFIYKMLHDGDGRKKPETKKKNPRLVTLPSPFYDMETDCFPVSENAEKQAGPTLSGRGIWSNGKKKKQLRARWWGPEGPGPQTPCAGRGVKDNSNITPFRTTNK